MTSEWEWAVYIAAFGIAIIYALSKIHKYGTAGVLRHVAVKLAASADAIETAGMIYRAKRAEYVIGAGLSEAR